MLEVILPFDTKKTQTKTCCTLVLKLAPLNQSLFFARYYISQLNQSSWKRHTCFKRIAATLQGTIWIVMKKFFQTKLYTFPKKELHFFVTQWCMSQLKQTFWKRHVIFKRSENNAATLQGVLCIVIKKFSFKKTSKMNVVSNWKRHLEKGMCFSKVMLQDFKRYFNL